MRLALALIFLLLAPPAWAENVVLGLSQRSVSITTNFDGSEILIFGAVKRSGAIPEGPPLDVVITVAGPNQPLTVRRKARRFGIWVNTAEIEVDSAPAFYAIATSAPFREALSDTQDLRHRVSIPRAIRSVGAPMEVENAASFVQAVIRIRKANGLYQLRENSVEVAEQTLFKTSIAMPANLIEGDYQTRILLTRSGEVVSEFNTVIEVKKVGLERFLFNLSRQQPMIYGLLSLAIAIFAGWGASAVFRAFQRN
ncbi:TIGR02186 family protein [Lentibacter sp. XHP0401]|uniref:TIGR02186 family protein n=1 Tax=Lentibacter sp. XHP0401 TaxID=2984334 RepID=UPI0021E7D321|nr:TIGR02186 family protein [Lentibacter sp. XHP0401]MCV2894067.1 TIGR02186 family protein [Lentibacter sp. XHP0401]